jgi:hypothetical protein
VNSPSIHVIGGPTLQYNDLSNGSLEIYWIFQLARDSKGLNIDILTSVHSKHADISMMHMPHVDSNISGTAKFGMVNNQFFSRFISQMCSS